jgi:cytochrome c556
LAGILPTDTILSRELTSLQEDISRSQRERLSASAHATGTHTTTTPDSDRTEAEDAGKMRDDLREFIEEMTKFIADAEKNITEHPTVSIVGALLIEILIGRSFGRRGS